MTKPAVAQSSKWIVHCTGCTPPTMRGCKSIFPMLLFAVHATRARNDPIRSDFIK